MGDSGTAVTSPVANVPGFDPVSPPASDTITVLVTGFGPFKSNALNASHLIAASLPSFVTLPPREPPAVGNMAIPALRKVLIHKHRTAIPVAYATVRTELPTILEDFAREHNGRRPDLIVHIGIASTRRYYSVETQAHRDGYRITDINGKVGFEDGEKLWKEKGLPAVLKPGSSETADGTAFNIETTSSATPDRGTRVTPRPADEHFLKTWHSSAPPGTDLRISKDAGRYLCEFIFYSSLSMALEEDRNRSVLFFHVPGWTDEQSVETGRKVAVALIKAMVTCWIDETQKST